MNLYDATVPVFQQYLRNLDKWIEKACAHADAKKFDPEVFVGVRLAPDQYPFSRQVTASCDAVKFCVAKLAGKDAPSHPDTEQTLAELRERIKKVRDYLETFTPADFEGAEERRCRHTWMPEGKTMRGGDYLDYWVLPNFHFHLTTAYALLRHNGVALTKEDFIGFLPLG